MNSLFEVNVCSCIDYSSSFTLSRKIRLLSALATFFCFRKETLDMQPCDLHHAKKETEWLTKILVYLVCFQDGKCPIQRKFLLHTKICKDIIWFTKIVEQWETLKHVIHFLDPRREGPIVLGLSVSQWLDFSKTSPRIILIFCMKVGDH